MPFLLLAVLLLLAPIALVPLSLVLRYRAGTARRQARGWIAAVNLAGLVLSVGLFLLGAAITNFWVPRAFAASALGLLGGCALGIVGLWLSRWEAGPQSLHYTPNRWLVLTITAVVTSRLLYGLWRAWYAWRSTPEDASWLAESGAAGSLAAGAAVLGYYLAYWVGVRRRLKRHARAR